MTGTLVLCATPIGNLGDISERLIETLSGADVVFAEDTRRTGQLLNHLGISKPMRSYFAGNERTRNSELQALLAEGKTIAFVSDAGMPAVSDPGSSAVQIAVAIGAAVTAIPGPSAPVTAVALSGFVGDRFVFEGFLPRKGAERKQRLASIADDQRTTVLFSATRRVDKDLADLAERVEPGRQVVVTRELTKLHEEVWRGTLVEAARHWGGHVEPRGEFTIVVEGATPPPPDLGAAVSQSLLEIERGASTSQAVKAVSDRMNVSKRELYELVLKQQHSGDATSATDH
jgi:16S rRNA (cytidine1402-2'-O)-methyltransferase